MVGVPEAPGVLELGVGPEGVEPWKGVHGRAECCGRMVWYGALLMAAWSGELNWRPEVAVRRAGEEAAAAAARGSNSHEELPGGLGWTLHL